MTEYAGQWLYNGWPDKIVRGCRVTRMTGGSFFILQIEVGYTMTAKCHWIEWNRTGKGWVT